MKNTINDVCNQLIMEMEKLNDTDAFDKEGKDLKLEIEKAQALAELGGKIADLYQAESARQQTWINTARLAKANGLEIDLRGSPFKRIGDSDVQKAVD